MVGIEGTGGGPSGSGDLSSAVAFRLRRPVSFGGSEVSTAAFLTLPFPLVERFDFGVSS